MGHQPRMRVGRQPAAGGQLAPEGMELCLADAPFQKRAGVHAGRRMALEEDLIARAAIAASKEVIEAHFEQRRGGGIRRYVTADARRMPVRLLDHRHRVPTYQALDPTLD